jgi:hypothetical protein
MSDPGSPDVNHLQPKSWHFPANRNLDNTVILRTTVGKPGWKPRWTTKPDLQVAPAGTPG